MPLSAAEKIVINGHEDRIKSLEDSTNALTQDIKPTLVELNILMRHAHKKLDTLTEDVEEQREELVRGSRQFDAINVRLAAVEARETARKNHSRAVLKWVGGVFAAVVIAAFVSLLGL